MQRELKHDIIIHLDLDGVLANMLQKVEQLTGRGFHDFNSRKEAWEELNKHQSIFRNLDLMPDALELVYGVVKAAEKYNCKVEILTAVPSMTFMPDAAKHKEEWVNQYFGYYNFKFKIGPYAKDKQNHCREGDILIDDSIMNIDQWNALGGIGILHISAKKSLGELNASLSNRIKNIGKE